MAKAYASFTDPTVAMLNRAGTEAIARGEFQQGLDLLRQSLARVPRQPQLHLGIGAAMLDRRLAHEALEHLEKALHQQPRFPEALYNRGNALMQLGRPQEALTSYKRALSLKRDFPLAHVNCGTALIALGRLESALECFDQALQYQPRLSLAHTNRADVLVLLARHDEALEAYYRALQCLSGPTDPAFAEVYGKIGTVLLELKQPRAALTAFQRALERQPDDPTLLHNQGTALMRLGLLAPALASFERTLALAPEFQAAHNNRGAVLFQVGRFAEALECFQQASQLQPDYAEAVRNCGLTLDQLDRPDEAVEQYERLIVVAPEAHDALGLRFMSRRVCADWSGYDGQAKQIIGLIAQDVGAQLPFPLLSLSDSPRVQQQCGRIHMASYAPPCEPLSARQAYGHERVRIGYLSGDFREHALSYLMAGVLERHDRGAFELYALSLRPPDESAYGRRIQAAVDRFVDLSLMSDEQAAELIRTLEIDILVDLVGYTQGARSGILARRPAPIQVNYLGFPATLGAPYIDYLIADEYLIPEALQPHYSEQIVYLPECFQANDDRRFLPQSLPSRSSLSLPEHALVLCCFNNTYKINPTLFSLWMRLLQAVPESVLWLLAGSPVIERNLRAQASSRGIDPARLLFAPRLPYQEHLRRLAAADLFLDTLPFNGGTTVSDALWVGLPVLSCSGEALAARMGGSLLRAVGLSELIARDLSHYQQLALELLASRERLAALREQLCTQRTASPLFNTARFTRHLEQAFLLMQRSIEQQLPPAHIYLAQARPTSESL